MIDRQFSHAQKHVNYISGAALLAVLVVAVVMVVLMGVASNLLDSRLTLAQDSKQYLQEQALVYAKRNELIYLLATQHRTVAGVSQGTVSLQAMLNREGFLSSSPIGDEIRVDGHEYTDEMGITYSIQNEAGLIPFNSSNQHWLKVVLSASGYTNSELEMLTASLADYADGDSTRRAAGAEAQDYVQKKQGNNAVFSPAPRNFLLQSCNELWKVSSWGTVIASTPSLIELCSLRRGVKINLNTVPVNLWKLLWPYSELDIVNARGRNQWFLSYTDILSTNPSLLSVSEDYYSYLGGAFFKVDVSSAHVRLSTKVELGQKNTIPIKLKTGEL